MHTWLFFRLIWNYSAVLAYNWSHSIISLANKLTKRTNYVEKQIIRLLKTKHHTLKNHFIVRKTLIRNISTWLLKIKMKKIHCYVALNQMTKVNQWITLALTFTNVLLHVHVMNRMNISIEWYNQLWLRRTLADRCKWCFQHNVWTCVQLRNKVFNLHFFTHKRCAC